jgi:chondroitin AC lyase
MPQEVRRVRIHWGETPGRQYRLEVSSDAVRWDTVQQVTEGKGGIEEFTWAPVNCRYIRLNGMRGTKGISAYAVTEMEVY